MERGETTAAEKRFSEARQSFSVSRVRREPDEYGYVSHLDMLIYLIERETDVTSRANLIAEGAQLYDEGMGLVPQDRFNRLLEDRFVRYFDLRGDAVERLCREIERGLERGKSSPPAAAFLADWLHAAGDIERAIDVLRRQQAISPGALPWVKEAEIQARAGQFVEATGRINSAKRRVTSTESVEVLWKLSYWSLLIAIANEEFETARSVSAEMSNSGLFTRLASRQRYPRGYYWRKAARTVPPEDRVFREHAKVWRGRVEDLRAGGRHGRISLRNDAGEVYYVDFQPRYFTRRDFRRGDSIDIVLTILPDGLRADDINSRPFLNTTDDLFLPC